MNKGFTLIELLAVITILSIIATITVFVTGNVMKSSKESLSEQQKQNLINATKIYCTENSCNDGYVCVSTLLDEGILDAAKVIDPNTRKELDGYVIINEAGSRVSYTYEEDSSGLCE